MKKFRTTLIVFSDIHEMASLAIGNAIVRSVNQWVRPLSKSYTTIFTSHGPRLMTAVFTNLNQCVVFHRADLLPLQPNSLWQIERGVVRTSTWTEAGDLRILGYWGTGDIVGQPLSRVAPYQVECLTSVVEASFLPPYLWPQVLEAVLVHGQQLEELFSILQERCFSLRLLNLLKWFARKFGRQVGQGELIDLRLTHQELADVLGVTRVTVTRLLKQFDQEGLIRRRQQRIILYPSASFNKSFRPFLERVVRSID